MGLILERLTLATVVLFVAFSATAHHSTAMYDPEREVTLEGVVTAFRWESPHVFIDLATAQEAGETVTGDDALTSIHITYTPVAAARLLEATTNRDGQKMAFVVDDDVWLAFTWEGPYGIGPDGTQLTLRNGMARAQGLVESIRECTRGP
jgi:hypothetical protein